MTDTTREPQATDSPPARSESGRGDDPLVVKYGDGYAAGYEDGLKDSQAELVSLRSQVAVLEGVLLGCIKDSTLSQIYVGDFYRNATKKVVARCKSALTSAQS